MYMIKCKLCGKDYKSIEMHLGTCLKKSNITREAYSNLPEYGVEQPVSSKLVDSKPEELLPELTESDLKAIVNPETAPTSHISGKDLRKSVFKGSFTERNPNRPLNEALSEFGISEEEFLAILNQWKGEAKVPVGMRMSQRTSLGEAEAEKLKDSDRIETYLLEAAEALTKKYGFIVTDVRSPKGNKPKTWVLRKKT